MGVPVLIIGASGSGKSTSLRNFTSDEIGLVNVSGKPLPFRGGMKSARLSHAQDIQAIIAKGTRRAYVIDDAQYVMSFEEMDTKLSGYDKWNAIGYGFIGLVRSVSALPDDTIVYYAHCISRTGSYLSDACGIQEGEAIAYLIAPPLEAMYGVDAALKAADVRLCVLYAPPSETNFGGGLLTGSQSACKSACDAFAAAVEFVADNPID